MRGLAVRDENDFLKALAGPDADCLKPPQLELLAAGRGAIEHRRHVETCLFCQTELELLTAFQKATPAGPEETAAVSQIVNRLRADPQWRPRAVSPAGSWWANWFASPMRGFAVAGLAAMLAVGVWFQQSPRDGEPRLDDGIGGVTRSSGQPELLSPLGDLAGAPAELRWRAVDKAVEYEVQLTEVDGTGLWRTRVAGTVLAVPTEARTFMTPRKTLFWSITALDTQGAPLAPGAKHQFRVVPGGR